MTSYWHKHLCNQASEKKSLLYLKCSFLPIGGSPHPIWTSTSGCSATAIRSASIHAQALCGAYRSDAVLAKWSGESPACSLPGCTAPVGDIVHLLSGLCPALRPKLSLATSRGLNILSSHPLLHDCVLSALNRTPTDWLKFLLDPSTEPSMIAYKQKHGRSSIYPLFRFSRTFIWTMHRERLRLKKQSHYLIV